MTIRRSLVAAMAVLGGVVTLLASCGNGSSTTGGTLDGVGRIPGNDFVGVATLPPDLASEVVIPEIDGAVLGAVAKGNRLLMIGDSILSSIAKRYGNEACSLLVPQGWNVALEAEAGQFVEFGLQVLAKRWNEGWDAIVIELGTNFAGSKERYRETMEKILDRVGDTPVLLLNTTVFRAAQNEVNAVIDDLADRYPNVTLLDWARISSAGPVIANDRVHPSPQGRVVLATAIARAVGVAPTSPGDCMKVFFQDDSRVLPDVMPGKDDTTVPPTSSAAPTSASPVSTSQPDPSSTQVVAPPVDPSASSSVAPQTTVAVTTVPSG